MKSERGRLSLEQFAKAKLPKWDKRELAARQSELKLQAYSKLKKIKKRMEADGRLQAPALVDNVEELERAEQLQAPRCHEYDLEHKTTKLQPDGVGLQHVRMQSVGVAVDDIVQAGSRGQCMSAKQVCADNDSQSKCNVADGPSSTTGCVPESRPVKTLHGHSPPASGNGQAALQVPGDGTGAEGASMAASLRQGRRRPTRPLPQLERQALKVQEKKAAQRAQQQEAKRLHAERLATISAAQRARQTSKAQYLKKTSRGQPLMRFRVDKILSELQRDVKA